MVPANNRLPVSMIQLHLHGAKAMDSSLDGRDRTQLAKRACSNRRRPNCRKGNLGLPNPPFF